MISDNIKRLRENAGLSQSALARKLGVTRASVNAWEMELSAPTAQYLVALAQLFHTTTDDILGLESEEQIVLRERAGEAAGLRLGFLHCSPKRNGGLFW